MFEPFGPVEVVRLGMLIPAIVVGLSCSPQARTVTPPEEEEVDAAARSTRVDARTGPATTLTIDTAGPVHPADARLPATLDANHSRADASAEPDMDMDMDMAMQADSSVADAGEGIRPDSTPAGERKVLLITGATPNASENATRAHLERRGFVVAVVSADRLKTADAAGQTLIIAGPGVGQSEAKVAALKDAAVPLLTMRNGAMAAVGMTGNTHDHFSSHFKSLTELQLVRVDHPLAAGLSGTVKVATRAGRFSYAKQIEGTEAVRIAIPEAGFEDRTVLFGYERGARMFAGTAPARRVAFFAGHYLPFSELTPEGLKLFDAAVDWLLQ